MVVKKTAEKKRGGNPHPKPGPGRPKGVPNKATAKAREAIGAFVENNVERMQRLLDKIEAEDGPKAAFGCITDVLEFHVPKLARTEHTGTDGGPIILKTTPEDEGL